MKLPNCQRENCQGELRENNNIRRKIYYGKSVGYSFCLTVCLCVADAIYACATPEENLTFVTALLLFPSPQL